MSLRMTEAQFAKLRPARATNIAAVQPSQFLFVVKGVPRPAPRQTRNGAKRREKPIGVVRYYDWRNQINLAAPKNLRREGAIKIKAIFYLPFPDSYSAKKRAALRGQPHLVKPDHDNLGKALCDALFEQDSNVYDSHYIKLWDDGNGARAVIRIDTDA